MNGAGMLCWFGSTAGLAMVAWLRAERVRARYPALPPTLVVLLALLVLLVLA